MGGFFKSSEGKPMPKWPLWYQITVCVLAIPVFLQQWLPSPLVWACLGLECVALCYAVRTLFKLGRTRNAWEMVAFLVVLAGVLVFLVINEQELKHEEQEQPELVTDKK